MNLEDIQQAVYDLVIDAVSLATVSGAGCIIQDDGTYPKTPTREEKLNEKGLVLTIWQPDAREVVSSSEGGFFTHVVYVPVVVEENVKVNRSLTGLTITALQAVRFVMQAVAGERVRCKSPFVFKVDESKPWDNLRMVNGVQRFLVNVEIINPITP